MRYITNDVSFVGASEQILRLFFRENPMFACSTSCSKPQKCCFNVCWKRILSLASPSIFWGKPPEMVTTFFSSLWFDNGKLNLIWLVVFNHLEKYESQWEGLSHIFWKINNVPNHQLVYDEATCHVMQTSSLHFTHLKAVLSLGRIIPG